MKRFTFHKLYPVLMILVLVGVWLVNGMNEKHTEQAAKSALQNSIYFQPWAAYGVWCQSELDLQNPRVPFTFDLGHPPGDRELVNETVRRLVRTGATQPWPEASIQRFRILRTVCVDSWSELYGKLSFTGQGKAAAFLHDPAHPTEEDYRQAIIHATYDEMGTTDAALEWFPVAP